MVEGTQVSHHRFAETIRHSLRDGFNGFLRALSGEPGFFATVIPEKQLASHELSASVGAPRPHDFAVRDHHHSSVDAAASIASRFQRP